jgi:hypothetical protein
MRCDIEVTQAKFGEIPSVSNPRARNWASSGSLVFCYVLLSMAIEIDRVGKRPGHGAS